MNDIQNEDRLEKLFSTFDLERLIRVPVAYTLVQNSDCTWRAKWVSFAPSVGEPEMISVRSNSDPKTCLVRLWTQLVMQGVISEPTNETR